MFLPEGEGKVKKFRKRNWPKVDVVVTKLQGMMEAAKKSGRGSS